MRILRNSLIAGLVATIFLYFLSVPMAELLHSLYLGTDWDWAYVGFQVLMGLGALLPWYGYGLIGALGGGVIIMVLSLILLMITSPFRRAA